MYSSPQLSAHSPHQNSSLGPQSRLPTAPPPLPFIRNFSHEPSLIAFRDTPRILRPTDDPKFRFPPLTFPLSELAQYLSEQLKTSEIEAINSSAAEALGGLTTINHELLIHCPAPTSNNDWTIYREMILKVTMGFVLSQLEAAHNKAPGVLPPTTHVTVRNAYQMKIDDSLPDGWGYELGRQITLRFSWEPFNHKGWRVTLRSRDPKRHGDALYLDDHPPITSVDAFNSALSIVRQRQFSGFGTTRPLLPMLLALRDGAIISSQDWNAAQAQLEHEPLAVLTDEWLTTPQLPHTSDRAQVIGLLNLLQLASGKPTLLPKAIKLWIKTQPDLGENLALVKVLDSNPALAPHILSAVHGLLLRAWTRPGADQGIYAWMLPAYPQLRSYVAFPCGTHLALAAPNQPCTPIDVALRFFTCLQELPQPLSVHGPVFTHTLRALGVCPLADEESVNTMSLMQDLVAACHKAPLDAVLRAYNVPGPRSLIDWIKKRTKLSPVLAIDSIQCHLRRELEVAERLDQKPTANALRILLPHVVLDSDEHLGPCMSRLENTLQKILETPSGREGLKTIEESIEGLIQTLTELVVQQQSKKTNPELLEAYLHFIDFIHQRELITNQHCINRLKSFIADSSVDPSVIPKIAQRLEESLTPTLQGDASRQKKWMDVYRLLKPHKAALGSALAEQLSNHSKAVMFENWRRLPFQDKLTDFAKRLKEQKLTVSTIEGFIECILQAPPQAFSEAEKVAIGDSLIEIITHLNQRRLLPVNAIQRLFEFSWGRQLGNTQQMDVLHWELTRTNAKAPDLLKAIERAIQYRFKAFRTPFLPDSKPLNNALLRLTQRDDPESHAFIVDTLKRLGSVSRATSEEHQRALEQINAEIVHACRNKDIPHFLLALEIIECWLNQIDDDKGPQALLLKTALHFIPVLPTAWKTKNSESTPPILRAIHNHLRKGLIDVITPIDRKKLLSEWPGLRNDAHDSNTGSPPSNSTKVTFDEIVLQWKDQVRVSMQSCPSECEDIAKRMAILWPTMKKNSSHSVGQQHELTEAFFTVLLLSYNPEHLREAILISLAPENAQNLVMQRRVLHTMKQQASTDWPEEVIADAQNFLKFICHRLKQPLNIKVDEAIRDMLTVQPRSKVHYLAPIVFDTASSAFASLAEQEKALIISAVTTSAIDTKKWNSATRYATWAKTNLNQNHFSTYIKILTTHIRQTAKISDALLCTATSQQVKAALVAVPELLPFYCALNREEALNIVPRLYGKAFEFEGTLTTELFAFHDTLERHRLYHSSDLTERWTICRGLIRNVCGKRRKSTDPSVIGLLRKLEILTDFEDPQQIESLLETNLRYVTRLLQQTVRSRNDQGQYITAPLMDHIDTHWAPLTREYAKCGNGTPVRLVTHLLSQMCLYVPLCCRTLGEALTLEYSESAAYPIEYNKYQAQPDLLLDLVIKHHLLQDVPLFFDMDVPEQKSVLYIAFMAFIEATSIAEQQSACLDAAILALAPLTGQLIELQRELAALSNNSESKNENDSKE